MDTKNLCLKKSYDKDLPVNDSSSRAMDDQWKISKNLKPFYLRKNSTSISNFLKMNINANQLFISAIFRRESKSRAKNSKTSAFFCNHEILLENPIFTETNCYCWSIYSSSLSYFSASSGSPSSSAYSSSIPRCFWRATSADSARIVSSFLKVH